jgi:hypothetical protein
MIIGYSVVYVNDDTTVKDILWLRRIVYSTWDKALDKAYANAEEKNKKYNNELDIISIINSESKNMCDKRGNLQVFTLSRRKLGEVGSIYIIPVYDE